MPMVSKSEFVAALGRSRLLTSKQLEAIQGIEGRCKDAREMAKRVRSSGWLTTWQLEKLLAGKTGFHFGEYALIAPLGRGTMGNVFKARDVRTGLVVALKVMSASTEGNPRLTARFHREIRLVSALRHPNVVCSIDGGTVDGRCYLVTEYVRGRTLLEWIGRERVLPVEWVCECARQTALGLQHIYERGLVHRDIKPGNLMLIGRAVEDKPHVKILDLGLGRFLDGCDDGGQLTRDGHTVGTLDFMAPEQVKSSHAADIRADIYALGGTMFQALTRRVPFESESMPERLKAKMLTDAPRIETLRADVPPVLADLVASMLGREADDRPAQPADVARALAPFSMTVRKRLAAPPKSEPGVSIVPVSAADTAIPTDTQLTIHHRPQRRSWVAVLLWPLGRVRRRLGRLVGSK